MNWLGLKWDNVINWPCWYLKTGRCSAINSQLTEVIVSALYGLASCSGETRNTLPVSLLHEGISSTTRCDFCLPCEAAYYWMNPLLKRLDMARDSKGSHSFTCHPLMNHTCLYSPAAGHHRPLTGTHYAYPRRDGQAELTWVTGYILR